MLIHNIQHHHRQFETSVNAPGISNGGTTIASGVGGASTLAFDPDALATSASVEAPPLAPGTSLTITSTPTSTSSTPSASPTSTGDNANPVGASGKSDIPVSTVVAACVGAFVGLAIVICLAIAWYKRSSDKSSRAARRNAEAQVDQQRAHAEPFNRLSGGEKSRGIVPIPPPPPPSAQEQQESDEKNFSMFKKSPSVRTAYTHKTTTDEENAYDLPQLQLKYPTLTLSEELALKSPDKPFAAAAAAAARQNSGVSWDGETLGDDSFLSMRSVRVESGTMSPTTVMAKMTPPATASGSHRWESAEVVNIDEEAPAAATSSRNPFTDMAEERKSRAMNPFFNAQDMNRSSRIVRSRSNSRTSRTSRGQSLVRSDSHATFTPHTNPFLDLQESMPISAFEHSPDALQQHSALPEVPPVPSTLPTHGTGNDRAMASLIAALDLTKEQVEERLRVVSMQGSTFSAYSNDESDIATVREFPLPPGTTAMRTP